MGYTAGTLDLSILGASDSAIASIDKTVKALNSLSRAITKINNTQFVMAGQQLEILFSKIAKATNSINVTNITNLASAAKSLSAISKIGNLQNVDFTKVASGFGTLTTAISPFIAKVKEAESSLTALYGILNKSSGKKISSLLGGNGASASSGGGLFGSFSRLFKISSWTAILYSAKRLGSYVGQIVQHGADYTETLNLWETAMGSNLTVATDFVNKMNEAYGISEKTLMNAQAIFKNMLGSLGQISDSMAYSLSEGITQMALDYASLYNVTFEQAFTKFQAALAGQVRPIRSVAGYDITETTLFQLYQQLGGEKTMRQLNRTEKQLLSILAIFNQMNASGATGDLAKTMESFANQSRVMAEGLQRVLTYSGALITHFIETRGWLTNINAVLILMGDTLKAVAESMGAIKSFADPFESTTEGALEAGEAIDEVKGKLLGFDKFRSLSGGAEDNALGLDQQLLDALAGFDSILGNASMEAKNLAEEFKIASGLFDENGVFQPDRWKEIENSIKSVGVAILLAFAGAGTVSAIKKFIGLMPTISESVKTVQMSFALLTAAKNSGGSIASIAAGFTNVSGASVGLANALKFLTGPVGIVLAILGILYATNEDFRNTINEIFVVLFDIIGQVLTPLIGLLGSLGNILGGILNILAPIVGGVIYHTLMPILVLLEAIVKVVSTLIYLLEALFRWDWKGFGQKVTDLWSNWSTGDYLSKVGSSEINVPTPYASGGLPDKGSMFVAGEAGAEIVYNMPSGQSGVANIKQIEQAMYNALARHSAEGNEPIVVQAYLDGEKVYENTTSRAKSRGKVWANV